MKNKFRFVNIRASRRSFIPSILAAAVAFALSVKTSQALPYFWDVNGTTAGFSTVVGAWNTGALWGPNATGTGGTYIVNPTAADDLNIVTATTNTGSITVTGAKIASSVTFASGVGAVTITGGTSLTIGGTGTLSGIFNASTSTQTIATPIILANAASTIRAANTGTLSITGGITGSQTLTLQNNGATNNGLTISGTSLNKTGAFTHSGTGSGGALISAAIGANVTNVIQSGANNQLTLSGTNLYTGTTSATAGIVTFPTSLAMPGYATSPATAFGTFASPKMSAASGATIAFPFGAATNAITNADVTNFSNGTYNIFAAGSSLGIDTTNASPSPAILTAVIANAGANAIGFTKTGTNALTLNPANTYTGKTRIANGTLNVPAINNVGATSGPMGAPTTVANATIDLGFGATTGTLNYTGPGETTDRVFNIASGTAAAGGGIINAGVGTLTITNPVTFTAVQKGLTIGGSGNIVFSSAIVQGGTPLIVTKTGLGTVTLSGVNTTSILIMNGGTVNTGAGGYTISNVGGQNIVTNAASVLNGLVTLAGVGSAANGGDVGAAAGITLDMSGTVIAGTIANANIDYGPSGTLILGNVNTYQGQTQINGTTIVVTSLGTADGAAASSLGRPAAGNSVTGNLYSTILMTSGSLRYVGMGEITDRALDLRGTTTAASIDQSGTGLLKFTGANTALGNGIKALTLTGSTAGTGEIAGAIVNSTGTTGITKTGTGKWTLSGQNTYTGPTIVSGGTLVLSQGDGFGTLSNTAIVINSGATLSPLAGVAGFSVGNTFTAAAGGGLTLNPLGALNLADGAIGNLNLIQNSTFTGNAATFNGGTINFDISATEADQIDVRRNDDAGTGQATSSGSIGISLNPIAGSLGVGTYTLINAGSAGSSLNKANFYLVTPTLNVGGTLYNLALGGTTGSLVLTVSAGGSAGVANLAFWNGTSNASWAHQPGGTGTATNWSAANNGVPDTFALPSSATNVYFMANSAANLTTTLDQAFTINSLTYAGLPGAPSSTIASGTGSNTLTINAAALNGNTLGNGLTVLAGAGLHTISANVVLGSSQTWTNSATNPLAINGILSGAGLTLTTAGTGAIQIGNGGTTGSIATDVVIVNSGVLAFNRSNTVTQGADFPNISGAGVLTQNGSGTVVLSGANTYTGATAVTNGILRFSGTVAATAVSASAGTIQMGSSTGLTSINSVTLSNTGTFDLNGFSPTIGAFGGAATNVITNNDPGTGTGTLTLSVTNATVGALITDGATAKTALRVNNAIANNQITLNTANTFSGGLILANNVNGTRLSPGTIVGTPWGTGPIIIGEAPTDKAGILFGVANQTLTNPIIFNTALGNDRVGIRADVTGITLAGRITANLAPATFTGNANGSILLTGQVSGASGLVLDITSLSAAATVFNVTLNNVGTPNNYAGDTVVNFGAAVGKNATLNLGAANQIPNGTGTGTVILNTNGTGVGTLNLAGFSETINGLSGSGTVDGTSGIPTLTLGDNNATGNNFSGIIRNSAGTLTLTKIGSGTQTLSGASTFTGPVNVNGGLIAFATAPATGGSLGNSTVVNLSGGGISYTAATPNNLNRPIAIGAADGTVNVANFAGVFTIPTVTSTAGNLIKTGQGTAVITGVAGDTTLSGGVVVNEGTLRAGFGTAGVATISVGATGNLDQSNGATQALTLGNTAGALTLTGGARLGFELNGALNDSIAVGATGTAVTAGAVTLNFYGTVAAGTYNLITAPSGLAAANYALGVAPSGFNYTINKTDSLVSVTVSPTIPSYWRGGQNLSWNTLGSGAANWTTNSAGTSDAASIPVFTDSVIFSATGAPAVSNTITTSLDAAFVIDSLQFTNVPTGITAVTIEAGAGGALTLTPASSISGIRVLSGGGNVTISAPLTTGAAQTWDVDPSGSLAISGNTAFNFAVNKTNTGALTLSGTNSGSGAITLSGGTLNLENPTAIGSGVFTIGAGTTINTSSAIALSTNNVQNWNGDFTFTGTGDLDLGTGAVTLGNSLTLTTPTVGSILTVGGSIGDGGSNRNLSKAGAGTLVLNAANTYGGVTAINGGVLRITNASGLGSAAAGTTQSGASALELDGSGGALILGTEALTINGGGITDRGALRNLSGDNTYGGTITMAAQSRINSDADTLTLSSGTSVTSAGFILVVGGAGNITIPGAIAVGTGGVGKDGTGTVTLSGTNAYTGNTTIGGGTLNITGSLTGNGTTTTGSNLLYGTAAGNSVVNVSGNIVDYLRFQGATNASANAAYIQTAGTVNFTSTQVANPTNVVASAGYGYMEITGGSLSARGRFAPSNGVNTTGVMYIGGTGTLDHSIGGEWLLMSYSPTGDGGRSMITVDSGGTLNRVGATNLFGLNMDRNNGYAVLNIAGGQVLNSTQAITFGNSTAASTGTSGFLNLAAGTLQIGANMINGNTGGSNNRAYLNFAGGTLKAQNTLTSAIPVGGTNQTFTSTLYGAIGNAGTGHDFVGGLTVDTNTFPVTLANNLVAPSSDGIDPSTLTVTGGSGYIGAPMVQFTGGTLAFGGAPAAGYAVVSSGVVTEIVITAPGSYDSAPTITLTGGGGTGASVDVGALLANTSGGLTKIGANTLTLTGTNTYTGATLVSAGTLQLNGAAATGLLSTSGITVDGTGTLGFTTAAASELDLSDKQITLSGGTLNFDLGEGVNDKILVDTFTLTANSAINYNSIGTIGGTYTLLTSANTIVNTGPFAIAPQTLGRTVLTPTINSNSITVLATVDEGRWNQTGGGNWSLGNSGGPSAPNWDNYKPTVAGDVALFGSAILAPSTVVVDTPHTVGFIRFANANAYTIGTNGSSNLTLNNGTNNAVITLTSGSHTIAENVSLASNMVAAPAATTTLTMSGLISGAGRTLTMNGGGNLLLSGVSNYTGTTTVTAGNLTVTGSTNQGTTVSDVLVANAATGNAVLNIQGPMTARFLSVGGVTGASGAVNISTGGSFTGGADIELGFTFGAGVTTGGYGYLGMTDGTVNVNRFQFGGQNVAAQNGVGVGLISGGTVNASAYVILARFGTSPGTIGSLTVAPGGTLNHIATTAGHNLALGWQGVGRAELNLTGGTITSATGRSVAFGGGTWTGTGILNLNAGTLTTTNITTTGTSYLNFNGGTLKAAGGTTLLPALTGVFVNGAFGDFNGGAVIDSNGQQNTISAPLIAPTGNGVATIPVTTGGSGYIGAPAVSITDSGSGFGATAIANMVDDGSGNGTLKIDSITITNPGNNYTDPLVSLVGGGNGVTDATLGTLTTAPNTSGGLTKIGASFLILSGANTYSGVTTINAGSITANSLNPNTSFVVNSGGQLYGGWAIPGATYTNNITLSGTGWFEGGINNGAIRATNNQTFSGAITLAADSRIGMVDGTTASTFSGQITGNFALNVQGAFTGNSATQTFTLANLGTASDFTGDTSISAVDFGSARTGVTTILRLGADNQIPNGGVTTGNLVFNGANANHLTVLEMNGRNETINGLSNASALGAIIRNTTAGASTLTIGDLNTTSAFSGVISNATGTLAITKIGSGALTLSGVNTYTGATSVTGGTLIIAAPGSIASTVSVATTGTLAGNGTIAGATTVAATGTVSPGDSSVATLNFTSTLALDAGSNYAATITGAATNDKVNVTGALTTNGNIVVTLSGYVPVANDTFDIADASSITGTPTFDISAAVLTSGLAWDTSTFATDGKIKVISTDPFGPWATLNGVTGGKAGDDDGDGVSNLLEFATNSDPKSGASGARVYAKMHTLGADNALTYTVATRKTAVFAAVGSKQRATKDNVQYTVEATNDLTTWTAVAVTELGAVDAAAVQAAIVPALPTLGADWEWHTFRTDDGTVTDPQDFIRLQVEATP